MRFVNDYRDCSKGEHTTVGIPVSTCLGCGKHWLTGEDKTEQNELASYRVVEFRAPTPGYIDFGNLKAVDVIYKIPRNTK